MKARSILLFLATLWLTAAAAQEQQGNSFSLQQAIEYAMKNSPNALNAQSDIALAKYRKREVAGLGYPQISASVELKDFINVPVSVIPNFVAPAVYQGVISVVNSDPSKPQMPVDQRLLDPNYYPPIAAQFGTQWQAGGSISVSQLIFSSDYIVALQAARYLEQIGTINANRTRAEVVAGVSKAYYSVLVNSARLQVINSNLDRLQGSLNELKAYNEQGLVEVIDVERLEVAYNNLATEKENVERFMALADVALRFQMGYVESAPLILTDSLPEEVNESPVTLSSTDPSARPEYQLLRANHELNYLNLKRQRLGYLPTLVAIGSGGYNAFRTEFDFFNRQTDWYPMLMIGGSLSLNIFDGLQRHNRIQQARIELDKSMQDMKMMEQAVGLEAGTAIVSFNNALATLNSQTRNRELAKHVQEVAQKKYQQGVGSNLEVVTAEAALREAEANYFNAVYNMLVAKIDYQKAIGAIK